MTTTAPVESSEGGSLTSTTSSSMTPVDRRRDLSSENRAILRLTPLENAIAGSVASITCGVVLTPVELVKCRLQALQETRAQQRAAGAKVVAEPVGALGLTARIMRKEGVTAVFKVLDGDGEAGKRRVGFSLELAFGRDPLVCVTVYMYIYTCGD